MSTRASAPRCASCGMPLAPDAESCAVCGARVPLIARPASGDEDPTPEEDAHRAGGLAAGRPAAARDEPEASAGRPASGAVPVASPAAARHAAGPGPGQADPVAPGPTVSFDAAAAARDLRASARPAPPGAPRGADDVPPVARRVLAHTIDLAAAVAVAVLGLFVVRVTDGAMIALPGVLGLLLAVGQVVAEGLGGATLGARLVGLRTVDERTGAVPGVGRAFVRQLVLGLGTLGCLVGYWVVAASGVWDSGPRRRGWHDKASGTTVVHASSPAPGPGGAARAAAAEGAPGVPRRRSDSGSRSASGPQGDSSPWTPSPPVVGPAVPPDADVLPAAGPGNAADRAFEDFFAPPPPSSPVLPPPPSAAPAATASSDDFLPAAPAGSTGPLPTSRPEADLLPPPPAASRRDRAARAAPAEQHHLDDDALAELEHTRVRDPESLRRRTGTLALHFDTGERVRVVGRGLVGRGPRAEDGQDILHVIVLNDAARSLSRVHAEFGPQAATADEDSAIWVTDRGSTNGTVVIDPAGTARVLPAGARALVGDGWTVRLGDREARVESD